MYKIRFLILMFLLASQAQGMGSKPDQEEFIDACKKGHTERVQAMLDAGANVNAAYTSGSTALMYATYWGKTSVIAQLIHAGADVNFSECIGRRTALMHTVYPCSHPLAVSQLIAAGANIKAVDKTGRTALMWAEKEGNTVVAEEIRKEMRWRGQGGVKKAWFAAVVQHQRAASRPGRVEIVE